MDNVHLAFKSVILPFREILIKLNYFFNREEEKLGVRLTILTA